MTNVALDIFYHGKDTYLKTVDYYSVVLEVDLRRFSKSAEIVDKLRVHFARHGIPLQVTSDRGIQLRSTELQKFSEGRHFEHHVTSPLSQSFQRKDRKRGQTGKEAY
ncbi:unnamed protein product [Echinostoma caproni]|uniref:Integrase catalytic domain-containing protein n=1 Tax=Echinostoma caproni TaxID=27848 RepID=A0A183ANR0_9TREM|nr:unnamed protein product [Echinostoma caproni]